MVWPLVVAGLVGGYLNNRSQKRMNEQNIQAQQQGTAGQQQAQTWAKWAGDSLMKNGVYQGPLTAPWNSNMYNAGVMAAQSSGMGRTALDTSQAGARTAQSFRPQMTTARNGGTWTGDQFQSKYFNPFLQQVGGAMVSDMGRARQMQLMSDEDKAIAAGAYGGSRQGVADAETSRGFYDTLGKNLTGLYAGGFDRAAGLGMQDAERFTSTDRFNADRSLQSTQGNQKAGIEGARVGLDGSRLSMDVGNSQYANFLRSAGLYGDYARYSQAYDQASLDRSRDLWNEWRDLPVRASGLMTAAAGGGSVQANSGPNAYQSFMQGAGGTMGMYGMAKELYGSPNPGTGAVNTGSGWTSGGGYGAGINPNGGEYYGSLGF